MEVVAHIISEQIPMSIQMAIVKHAFNLMSKLS